MSMALTIAIRYAAQRRQFGPDKGNEIAIIEYQLHVKIKKSLKIIDLFRFMFIYFKKQYRLLPPLAVCYVLKNYSFSLFNNLVEFYMGMMSNDTSDRQADFGKEIHALSSAIKPYSSWSAQQIIQECREACGGHGYLKSSRFGYLRNTNDPILTFEGDNNVLLQQTSNYLISAFEDYLKTNRSVSETPLQTTEFLNKFDAIINLKFMPATKAELLNQSSSII